MKDFLVIAMYDDGVGFSVATDNLNIDIRDYFGSNGEMLDKYNINYDDIKNCYDENKLIDYFIEKLNINPSIVFFIYDSDITIYHIRDINN